MPLYTNNTRRAAIVTVKITASQDTKKSLMLGLGEEKQSVAADVGYHDFLVDPSKYIEVAEGTQAEFVAARSGD